MAPEQKWRDRFQNLLKQQEQPIGLRDAAELMGLSSDEEKTLRSSVGRDTACRRWLTQKPRQGVPGLYFMPHEFRNGSNHLQQKHQNKSGVQTRETHPLKKGVEMLEVGVKPFEREGIKPQTNPKTHIQAPTPEVDQLQQNTPLFSGVSLSPPILNGHTDAVWEVIDNNPGLHPARLANKIYAETNVEINGSQVRALLQSRPLN
ncbi:hypothetical protein PMIT1342_00002 [Prochlorococcus marinus str. MIT 1342]|uniref:hypothetical protein n=1 Tax=Prochlorococcus TaxID=1218 RepID=UPI0007B3D412|nr:hypothetical protein [Prochlorococcus marinus]KZR85082.1 hypothetical protein PMIT1342_00002 [Prochlorococcus marinus str. MIT 1342]